MDEMKLESKLITGIASKLAQGAVRKKLGVSMGIQLNALRAVLQNGQARVHLDLDLDLSKEELEKLLRAIGL